jgi:hypothetical protein
LPSRGFGTVVGGLAAFSAITSATLWYFCFSGIRMQGKYARAGTNFGNSGQLDLAWLGPFACVPPLVASLSMAWGAHRLPRALAL